MKRIAILNCLRANDVCAGCGCMDAFYDRLGAFEAYKGEELRLEAFLRCSCCVQEGGDPAAHPRFLEKADRLVKEGVEIVHLGVCTRDREGNECRGMAAMAGELERRGLVVVRGTHPDGKRQRK